MNRLYRDNSTLGLISVILGVLGIVITITIIFLLKEITALDNANIGILVNTLNTLSSVETLVKPSGLLLGVISIFQKSKKKDFAKLGIVLNIISIVWTVLLAGD